MGYCFMSFDKIHTRGSLSNHYSHNYRMKPVSNAIPELKESNEELVTLNGKTYSEAIDERLASLGYGASKKVRKNAVLAIEVLTTFSREDMNRINIEKWKKDNVDWLQKAFNTKPEKYGDNLLSVIYHGDEVGNLHCHALVLPIDDKGNLNASYYVGDKWKVIELQNTYAYKMKSHGLKRGIEGSIAKHQDIKKFYGELNAGKNIEIPEYQTTDTPESYRMKISELVNNLHISHLKELEDKDRKFVEAQSKPLRNLTILEREKHLLERELRVVQKEKEELIREFGPINVIKSKLKTLNLLNNALRDYPDEETVKYIADNMNRLVAWEKSKEKKRAKREKILIKELK